MTDWWADSAAWASAVGTIGATVTALTVAWRGWRDAAAERADRDAAQARQVVVTAISGTTMQVTNFSAAPILYVQAKHVWLMSMNGQPLDKYQARLQGADPRGVRVVLSPQESVKVDISTQTGAPPPPGGYALTLRFTDAAGLDWERTGNDPPRRLINDPSTAILGA